MIMIIIFLQMYLGLELADKMPEFAEIVAIDTGNVSPQDQNRRLEESSEVESCRKIEENWKNENNYNNNVKKGTPG